LKIVDFPTFGSPTIPAARLIEFSPVKKEFWKNTIKLIHDSSFEYIFIQVSLNHPKEEYMRKCLSLFVSFLFIQIISVYAGYTDFSHYSQTFNSNRNFRVFTGTDFDTSGNTRYPVIYYCPGCQGSYTGDSYSSYSEGGYVAPYCTSGCTPAYSKPFNADFQAFANDNEVIVVAVDGTIPGVGGCYVWIPYYFSASWGGNEYRFGKYIRELFTVVDSIYPTIPEPQYRAITGLSMGGAASIWMAAQNPHLVRSMSTFCHSPSYVSIGGPGYITIVDVSQLWRNFRGVSTRVTANSGDYLYGMSWNLSQNFDGATLDHEYHRTPFYRHWAFHIDSQFLFHMKTFENDRQSPVCFSAVNLYPDFDAWGWNIASNKADSGWIYLKDATKSGFALLTRKWLPFGTSMDSFSVTVTTAPNYFPNTFYSLTSYDYRTGSFITSPVITSNEGRISVGSNIGMGKEFGISGNGLPVQLAFLTDTVMENIYIESGKDTAISGKVVNLSQTSISNANIVVRSESPFITVKKGRINLGSIGGSTAKTLNSFVVLRATIQPEQEESDAVGIPILDKRVGFISIKFTGTGVDAAKEHLIQVNIMDSVTNVDSTDVKVFDGKSESISIFRANRYGAKNYFQSITVNEGVGNSNGIPEQGEIFSIWLKLHDGINPTDTDSWHPVVPVSGMNMPGISFLSGSLHEFDICRYLISAQMSFTRVPSAESPVDVVFKTVSMHAYPGSANRVAEGKSYQLERFYRVRFPLGTPIAIERGNNQAAKVDSWLRLMPNPFNPVVNVSFALPAFDAGESVVVMIANPTGKIVRTFRSGEISRNDKVFHITWDGINSDGSKVASGVYTVRVITNKKILTAKSVYIQ
jgi:hypothetical protein